MKSSPVQVSRTRLQLSQKLWRERRDEADPPAGLGDPHVARRPAGALGRVGEGPARLQIAPQVLQRPVLVEPVLVAEVAHRHDLDEGEVEAALAAPLHQPVQFVLVDALERHGVDLDLQARLDRGVDARPCTWASRPQRVIVANFSASSVSSETLTRRTPQSASSLANRRSWLPFVVSVSSLSAPVSRCRDIARKNVMIPLRTSGSPPVMRSFSTPSPTKAEQSRSSSSSVSNCAFGRNSMCSAMQ